MTSGYDADGQMYWDDAVAWADQLEFGGYSDWRLPATVFPDNTCSNDVGGATWFGLRHWLCGERDGTSTLG